ncbi:MAG: hypothetical protein L0229_06590, partial [Blastocatellia bacterium]|nr:hypothetical protein [Blastocatellia bacterium]
MLKVMYMIAQPLIRGYFWSRIDIINPVQFVQCHCVAQKVIAFKSRVDSENAIASLSALNVMKENGDHR